MFGKDRKMTKRDLLDSTKNIGLDNEEIVLALQIMEQDGDNVAYFGINGFFLYSEFDRSEETVQ